MNVATNEKAPIKAEVQALVEKMMEHYDQLSQSTENGTQVESAVVSVQLHLADSPMPVMLKLDATEVFCQ